MQACNSAGIKYIELPVAYDALTVVVNPANTWAKSLTVAELKKNLGTSSPRQNSKLESSPPRISQCSPQALWTRTRFWYI